MKKRILVFDDDKGISEAFELILHQFGYAVEVFTKDGLQIQKKIQKNPPDLIILDILLSGSDGRVICRTLKNNKETRNIPIIMVSAHPTAGEKFKEYGADAFLTKPFEVQNLLDVIAQFLDTKT
jgi:DNA-binding response OmpR family regulator